MKQIVCSDTCLGFISALNQLYTLDLSQLKPTKDHYKLQFRLDGVATVTSADEFIGVIDRQGRAFRVTSSDFIRECLAPRSVKGAFTAKHSLLAVPVIETIPASEPEFDSLKSICEAAVHPLINLWTAPELCEFADAYQCYELQRACEVMIARNLAVYFSPSNWELLLVLSEESLGRVQSLVPAAADDGFLKSLKQRLDSAEVSLKPKAKRVKNKTEASKGVNIFNSLKATADSSYRPVKPLFSQEDFPTLQEAHSRPLRQRSNTDNVFIIREHIPEPVLTWTKPSKPAPVDFNTVQAKQRSKDIKMTPWGEVLSSERSVKSIAQIQQEERDKAELEEALLLIAAMEAREAAKVGKRPRYRRKQTN